MASVETKRDIVLSLLDEKPKAPYVPAAFFLHFDGEYHRGPAAVAKHLEFFEATDMDLVKIQFELPFPRTAIGTADDWRRLPKLGPDFYGPQLEVVQGLVEQTKSRAVVVLTLYSPFMIAGQMGGEAQLDKDAQAHPEAVLEGLQTVADGLVEFVRACHDVGLDGFYHSTQGGEEKRFENPDTFNQVVKPIDLMVMNEIADRFRFNILHVCDYHRSRVGGYAAMEPYLEYPGQVISCSTNIGGRHHTPKEISQLFGRPFLGGMERLGLLATGTEQQVRAEARKVLEGAFPGFFLGADCTVPGTTPWSNLAAAIGEAHQTNPDA